jgi:hypothetical protein
MAWVGTVRDFLWILDSPREPEALREHLTTWFDADKHRNWAVSWELRGDGNLTVRFCGRDQWACSARARKLTLALRFFLHRKLSDPIPTIPLTRATPRLMSSGRVRRDAPSPLPPSRLP